MALLLEGIAQLVFEGCLAAGAVELLGIWPVGYVEKAVRWTAAHPDIEVWVILFAFAGLLITVRDIIRKVRLGAPKH